MLSVQIATSVRAAIHVPGLGIDPIVRATPERPNRFMTESPSEITRLVAAWSDGEDGAFGRLMELVYDELRDLAHHHLALGARDDILDTTVLVHEVFLRLAAVEEWDARGRARFFAFCSRAMRHVLIDFARRQQSARRGGTRIRVPLRDEMAAVEADAADSLVVEDVLQRLESRNERMSRVFECRYYGGMSVEETASALDTSTRTVEREWARARAYLRQALEYEGGISP